MSAPAEILRLLQVSDSAFPSGAFGFSGGLEALAADDLVPGAEAVAAFLAHQVIPRFAGIDRAFLERAHAAAPDADALLAVDADCEAFVAVAEAGEASRRQGLSILTTHGRIATPGIAPFAARVRAGETPGHAAVVQGLVGHALGLSAETTATAALYGAVQSCLAASVRLGRVGALGAQSILADLVEPMAEALAGPAPSEPAAFVPLADVALSRHREQAGRLFAS